MATGWQQLSSVYRLPVDTAVGPPSPSSLSPPTPETPDSPRDSLRGSSPPRLPADTGQQCRSQRQRLRVGGGSDASATTLARLRRLWRGRDDGNERRQVTSAADRLICVNRAADGRALFSRTVFSGARPPHRHCQDPTEPSKSRNAVSGPPRRLIGSGALTSQGPLRIFTRLS